MKLQNIFLDFFKIVTILHKNNIMVTIKLSNADAGTVSVILAEKAMQMNKKGTTWKRGNRYLSCVDMGKLANKIRKPLGESYDFKAAFKK